MKEMYREYLKSFFAEFDFPEEARTDILAVYDRILEKDACRDILFGAVEQYVDTSYDYDSFLASVHSAFVDADVNYCSGEMIFVILLSRRLRELYAEAGISDEIYKNTMLDIRYKLIECKCVYNVWGIFVAFWDKGFFRMTRFGLGRLQYDITTFKNTYSGQGIELSENSPILNVHIPRTGTRLDYELVKDSYRRAMEFFAPWFSDSPIAFMCNSWLLYPKNREILAPTSNLYKFMSDYDVFFSKDFSSYREMWRLFDVQITEDIDALPQDTSLRRAYADIMRRGEPLGTSLGVYVPNDLKN